ncbi:hypothetical protein HQ571_05170 [Candidatus Kuenenbacteria bacterium]|nr:hypothetical protein [Candidatus Kuenenbacteria bacterium]
MTNKGKKKLGIFLIILAVVLLPLVLTLYGIMSFATSQLMAAKQQQVIEVEQSAGQADLEAPAIEYGVSVVNQDLQGAELTGKEKGLTIAKIILGFLGVIAIPFFFIGIIVGIILISKSSEDKKPKPPVIEKNKVDIN